MSSEVRAATLAAVASLALHLTLVLVLLRLPAAPLEAHWVEFDNSEGVGPFAEAPNPAVSGDANSVPDRLLPGGGASRQNIDAANRGEGGDRAGADQVILLLPRADGVTLQDSPRTSNDGAQTQRIRTASSRATREDRRATPHPHDQPFLASGSGTHPERRPVSAEDAAPGARSVAAPTTEGARDSSGALVAGTRATAGARGVTAGGDDDAEESRPGPVAATTPAQTGSDTTSPGRGIAGGRGDRNREAARVAHGRPAVDEGPAATNANTRDARVRDNRDAELLAAQMVESWVESSRRSGAVVGEGRGGVGGGGAPGAGGSAGTGGRARSHQPGPGRHGSLDTSDGRYHRWYLALERRVRSRLTFPRARMVAMDQGLSVVRFVVNPNGTIVGRPSLVRSSGFDDFDAAAVAAIVEAAPFAPLPPELSAGVERHAVRMAVEHSNPMVR
ncbi:MAG: TonB family protein [Deltaproteobacteria bacterium]|nr:TonB family protein [Deltaproteobacteria bacterium]